MSVSNYSSSSTNSMYRLGPADPALSGISISEAATSTSLVTEVTSIDLCEKQRCFQILLEGLETYVDNTELQDVYATFPGKVQEELYSMYCMSCKTPSNPELSKTEFSAVLGVLLQIKKPFVWPTEDNILKQSIEKTMALSSLETLYKSLESADDGSRSRVLDVITERKKQIDNQQIVLFRSLLVDPEISARQLKTIYKSLNSEVQALLPPPPYLGHDTSSKLHHTYGSHPRESGAGTTFRVFAPHALAISVVIIGENGVVKRELVMHKINQSGDWEVSSFKVMPGDEYCYRITTETGEILDKLDPFAFQMKRYEASTGDAEEGMTSIVANVDEYSWGDSEWIRQREMTAFGSKAMNIFEVHPYLWKRHEDGSALSYQELSKELISYCRMMHYTHVQLMAVMEHPVDKSWGYQVSGFFAPTDRMGSVQDFQALIDALHQNGIGVVMDWIPAHFAKDHIGLELFDGKPLFEPDDSKKAFHPTWGTKVFDYSNPFVRSFLLSSAEFWIEKMHIDALRVDAVTSMLDLNYDRPDKPYNNHKKKLFHWNQKYVDLDALMMLRELNANIHKHHPGVFTMAEEMDAFPALTTPVTEKKARVGKRGVGFDARQAIGIQADLIGYCQIPFEHRRDAQDFLIRTLSEMDRSEVITLPAASHDESAHGKKTLLKKMSGEDWDPQDWKRFAGIRNFHGVAATLPAPGGKLDFMGNAEAVTEEWSWRVLRGLEEAEKGIAAMQWSVLSPSNPNVQRHLGVQKCVSAFNRLRIEDPSFASTDFKWIAKDDRENSVVAYMRGRAICIHNFSAKAIEDYVFRLPAEVHVANLTETINTDSEEFGGSGVVNPGEISLVRDAASRVIGFKMRMPPLATVVLS